jgi:hypothetical protein
VPLGHLGFCLLARGYVLGDRKDRLSASKIQSHDIRFDVNESSILKSKDPLFALP